MTLMAHSTVVRCVLSGMEGAVPAEVPVKDGNAQPSQVEASNASSGSERRAWGYSSARR